MPSDDITNTEKNFKEKTYAIIGSSGELERYNDVYADVDEEQIYLATKLEEFIFNEQHNIERSFLRIGAALAQFDEQELWRARGYPSFRSWTSELSFSYEHATRLIRIVRDLVPLIGDTDNLPPVSTMKELLPMLSDGSSSEEILDAYNEVRDLTTADAKRRIREIRGVDQPSVPATFRAVVQSFDDHNRVRIERFGDDGDYYTVTPQPLYIKHRDWPRWESRFGSFIEYEN